MSESRERKSKIVYPSEEEAISIAEAGPTLIFDGVCNLCNGAMHWYYDRIDESVEETELPLLSMTEGN